MRTRFLIGLVAGLFLLLNGSVIETIAESPHNGIFQFAVSSRQGWQKTGVNVNSGDHVEITYISGQWTVDQRLFQYVGPDGYLPDIDHQIDQTCKAWVDEPFAKLMGRIDGEAVNGIGSHATFVAGRDGAIELAINDKPECYSDNDGSILMQISVGPNTPPTLAPSQVVLEDFMIADQLREFSPSLETTVFKSSALWLKITNRGDVDFVPPSGTVNYTLEVRLLDSAGQELDSYDFTSATSLGLAPLSMLGAHQSFYPSPLVTFFPMHAVNAGTLQVTLVPEKNSGLESLALAKPITVHEHLDSFYKCCATVIGEIIKLVSIKVAILCPECAVTVFGYTVKAHIALKMGELVTDISNCSDMQCALTKTAAWTIQLLLDLFGNPGQVISFVFDVILKMGNELPPCLKVVDFVNAFLNQLIFHRLPANGILTQSPVYPLVINAAGQRTGFLADGALVEEIPDSRAVLLNGDKRLVLIPGNQELRFEINGYADGTADIDITLSQDEANGITLTYTDVPVRAGGRFLLGGRDPSYALAVDADGSGHGIQMRSADHFTLIGSAAQAPQPRVEIPTPALPNPNPAPNVPTSQQDNSAVIVVLVLTLVGAIFATFITFALTPRKPTRVGNSNAGRAVQISDSTHRATPSRTSAYLQVKAGEQVGKKFSLVKPATTLGRDSQNDIVLADVFASRRHAVIRSEGSEFVLEDLKTANGTWVNGKLASSGHVLRDGDEIQIGRSSFKFNKG